MATVVTSAPLHLLTGFVPCGRGSAAESAGTGSAVVRTGPPPASSGRGASLDDSTV
jgi:hypothetical protein